MMVSIPGRARGRRSVGALDAPRIQIRTQNDGQGARTVWISFVQYGTYRFVARKDGLLIRSIAVTIHSPTSHSNSICRKRLSRKRTVIVHPSTIIAVQGEARAFRCRMTSQARLPQAARIE